MSNYLPSLYKIVKTICSTRTLFIFGMIISILILGNVYHRTGPRDNYFATKFVSFLGKSSRDTQEAYEFRMHRHFPRPLVLLWTPLFGHINWLPMPGYECPVDCEITSDRNKLIDSSAIVFHLADVDIFDLPAFEGEDQRWILHNLEVPPFASTHALETLQNQVHWTMTYRRDSDIFIPYGQITNRKEWEEEAIPPEIYNKQHLVCWIVSKCETPSKREIYVNLLKKYIPVKVFGQCGEMSCPNRMNAKSCYNAISKHCKFYLSFEKNLCLDYVSEKPFYALDTGMVPVVMGNADYSKILPNNSYINVFDFESPKDLALHLLDLDRDYQKYLSYYAWKRYHKIHYVCWSCVLCKKIHDSLRNPSIVTTSRKNLAEWWNQTSNCFSWAQHYNLL